MNVQLKDITVTARDGRVSHLDQVYIRGSHVRFFIVPDMLRLVAASPFPYSMNNIGLNLLMFLDEIDNLTYRNAPMFRSRGVKGRGVGLARGRATVSRARASGRGAPRG
jgi:small nuclear ribonucleoprotein D3